MTILSPDEKFLIMERIDNSATLSNVSPFLTKKVIDSVIGREVQQRKILINLSILIHTKKFYTSKQTYLTVFIFCYQCSNKRISSSEFCERNNLL